MLTEDEALVDTVRVMLSLTLEEADAVLLGEWVVVALLLELPLSEGELVHVLD